MQGIGRKDTITVHDDSLKKNLIINWGILWFTHNWAILIPAPKLANLAWIATLIQDRIPPCSKYRRP
ncbi:hypothetical protein BC941DRAFT_465754 [Chlamydoabsidia padenii]|nr:hypothetical protein BC941DRAFT_465754 [Chlamydoabsidia padenii]